MRTDIEKKSSTYRVTSLQCSDCSQALGTAVPSTGNPVPNCLGTGFPDGWDKGLQQSLAYGDASTSPVRMRLFLTRSEIPGENEGAVKSPYSS